MTDIELKPGQTAVAKIGDVEYRITNTGHWLEVGGSHPLAIRPRHEFSVEVQGVGETSET